MIGFEPSLFVDEPSKTYTMTWKMFGKYGFQGYSVCRERIWPLPLLSQCCTFQTAIEFYLWLIDEKNNCMDFRLTRCGRLVARSATYQGV